MINRIRYVYFMSGVLAGQQHDPFCSRCKACANTLARIREMLAEVEQEAAARPEGLSQESRILAALARTRLETVNVPEDAVGQKKAGNCRLPEGVCFVKSSKKLADLL